jgi:hypothetical protein
MFDRIGKAIESSQFKSTFAWFEAHLPAMFGLFENLVKGIGDFLEAMVKLGVVIAPIVFTIFGAFFKILTDIMNYLAAHPELAKFAAVMTIVAGAAVILLAVLVPLLAVFGTMAGLIALVVVALVAVVAAVLIFHHQIAEAFDDARHNVADWADDTLHAIDNVIDSFRKFNEEVGHDIESAWDTAEKDTTSWANKFYTTVAHAISQVIDSFREFNVEAGHEIESAWDTAYQNTVRAGTEIVNAVTGFFERMYNAVVHGVDEAVNYVKTMPGKFVSALASLASLMYNIGVNAINGLIHGIESMVGGLIGEVEHIASEVSGAFSKVLSIFSPSRVFFGHGENIMLGLIGGMQAHSGAAVATISGIASQISGSFHAQANASISASTYASNAASSSASGQGDLVVAVDGKQLLRVIGARTYAYNQKNSGQVTGVIKPS